MRPATLHRWAAVVTALTLEFASIPSAVASGRAPPPPPPPTPVDQMDVEQLNDAAINAFKAKDYDEAARLFEMAFEKSPEPNYLFNIGRVFEEKGDFPQAIEYYKRFVRLPEVEMESREIALERIEVLEKIIKEEEPEEPPAPPPPLSNSGNDGGRKPTPPLRIAGYVLLGVGGATLAVAAGFGGAALGREGDLKSLSTLEPRNEAIKKGQRNALVADSLFIAGGIVALTGLVLTLASLRKGGKGKSKRASVTPTAGPDGAGLQARVRF